MTVRNALDAAFDWARGEQRAALIPYLTAGFPDRDSFVEIACGVLDAGADALEIGIPFSDPLLDGPAIQRSQQVALEEGTTPLDCLRFASEISGRTGKALLFMGAYNPIFRYGVERFSDHATRVGVSGLVVPDVPYEEQDELLSAAQKSGIHLIQLLAPTSPAERVTAVCSVASGFVYCISVTGVTGVRSGVADAARPLVERVRVCSDVPVAVGFGISGPEAAQEVAAFADGVIVGSALINVLADAPAERRVERAREFVAGLCEVLTTSSATSAGRNWS